MRAWKASLVLVGLAVVLGHGRAVLAVAAPRLTDIEAAMVALAPQLARSERTDWRDLAHAIDYISRVWEIDPLIAVAVAFRESTFRAEIGDGRVRGSRGEIGWFQVLPWGVAAQSCGGCDLRETECNVSTALCWMALRREECGDDPWVWVAAYGRRGRCARPRHARSFGEVRAARRNYCQIADASGWPR